jgi:hypothetical protein
MTDCELVYEFQTWERQLKSLGYSISAIKNGFYIHNKKGTIVADVKTISGLAGFSQAIEYSRSLVGLEDVPGRGKLTPYEVGERLYMCGSGVSDIWASVKKDSEMDEAFRGYTDAMKKASE